MKAEESIQEHLGTSIEILRRTGLRIVLAESCTCGMMAAAFGEFSGVSEVFCGSAVSYREDSKINWLGVESRRIQSQSAVSDTVAIQMAEGVLAKTPEAGIASSITGHLGPGAPSELDGVAFIAVAHRHAFPAKCLKIQLAGQTRLSRRLDAVLRWSGILAENLRDLESRLE